MIVLINTKSQYKTRSMNDQGWNFSEAIVAEQLTLVQDMLDAGRWTVNVELPNGLTPLLWAVHNQKQAMAELLLANDADVNLPMIIQSMSASPLLRLMLHRQHMKVNPMQMALYTNNIEMVEVLIDNGAYVYNCEGGIKELILIAVRNSRLELVTKLVNRYKEHDLSVVHTLDFDLAEPVLLAVKGRNRRMLAHLIRLGADVTREHRGLTPLVLAAQINDLRLCLALMNSGARINDLRPSDGTSQTPLTMAIKGGLDESVQVLLRLGADPNVIIDWSTAGFANHSGVLGTTLPSRSSALHLAVAKGSLGMVKLLIKAGADISHRNITGDTALHQLFRSTHNKFTPKLLLTLLARSGSDSGYINVQNHAGETPLILATSTRSPDLALQLIQRGADLNLGDTSGYTVLHHAVLVDNDRILTTAVAAGASVDGNRRAGDTGGGPTPLHVAVSQKKFWAVELLHELGADQRLLSTHGDTLLHLAVKTCSLELVESYISAGQPVNARTRGGDTALTFAARQEGLHICHALLRAAAEINARDKNMETALSSSVYFGQEENAKLLIAEGADPDMGDSRDFNPLYWAIYNNRVKALKCLLVAGAKYNRRTLLNLPNTIPLSKNNNWSSWLGEFFATARSLQDCCRLGVRRGLMSSGKCISLALEKLALPTQLKNYILFKNEPLFSND